VMDLSADVWRMARRRTLTRDTSRRLFTSLNTGPCRMVVWSCCQGKYTRQLSKSIDSRRGGRNQPEEWSKMGACGCGKEALERNSEMAKLVVQRGRGPALTMKAGGGAHGSPADRRREGSGGYVRETKGREQRTCRAAEGLDMAGVQALITAPSTAKRSGDGRRRIRRGNHF
jgi:hypothetical protein